MSKYSQVQYKKRQKIPYMKYLVKIEDILYIINLDFLLP